MMFLKTTSLFQPLHLINLFVYYKNIALLSRIQTKVKEKSLSLETKGHLKQLSYSKSRFQDFKPGSLSFVMTAGKVYSFFLSK